MRSKVQLPTRFVTLIAKLYVAEARSAKWDASRRRRLRARYSRRVLERIEQLLVAHRDGVVSGSLLGKALQYLSSLRPWLVRYVENSAWPSSARRP